MRRLPTLLAAASAAVVILAGCSGNAPSEQVAGGPRPDQASGRALPDTLSIPVGAERTADGGRIVVRFLAKVSDSRCPANAVCVWEGDASVRLRITAGGETRDTVLHTRTAPTSLAVAGYLLTVPGLLPYPGTYPDDAPEPAPTVLVSVARP